MNRIKLTLVCLLFSWGTYAQQSTSSDPHPLEGTYQIEMVNTRTLPSFHTSLYDTIAAKRQPDVDVIHVVDDNMRLVIFSESKINQPGFTPPERIAFIREDQ